MDVLEPIGFPLGWIANPLSMVATPDMGKPSGFRPVDRAASSSRKPGTRAAIWERAFRALGWADSATAVIRAVGAFQESFVRSIER